MRKQLNRRCLNKAALLLWSVGLGWGLAQAPFHDVPPDLEYIRFLYQKGIVQGYPDGTFRGQELLTRYQAAAMLYRAYLAFADDVARRVKEALSQEAQVRLEEALAAIAELKEALAIVQQALGEFGEVKADLAEARRDVEALAEELGQLSSQAFTREEASEQASEILGSLGALEELIRRSEEGLKALQARLSALEEAQGRLENSSRELEGRLQASAGELNKRLFDLGGRLEALERQGRNRPKLALEASVGLFGGQAEGAVGLQGEAGGVRLQGRLSTGGLWVQAEAGSLSLSHEERGGLAESRAELRLFEGVSLRLGLGYGDSAAAVARLVHEPEGGLIPGLVAEVGAGLGFYRGELVRNLLLVKGGFRLGEVTPSVGYWRLQGEEPYSLLEGGLDWQASFGRLLGYYRLVAFLGSGSQGSEWGVSFTLKSNPFLELGVQGAEGLVAGEPGSFSFRYRPEVGSRSAFVVRAGYRLEF